MKTISENACWNACWMYKVEHPGYVQVLCLIGLGGFVSSCYVLQSGHKLIASLFSSFTRELSKCKECFPNQQLLSEGKVVNVGYATLKCAVWSGSPWRKCDPDSEENQYQCSYIWGFLSMPITRAAACPQAWHSLSLCCWDGPDIGKWTLFHNSLSSCRSNTKPSG